MQKQNVGHLHDVIHVEKLNLMMQIILTVVVRGQSEWCKLMALVSLLILVIETIGNS